MVLRGGNLSAKAVKAVKMFDFERKAVKAVKKFFIFNHLALKAASLLSSYILIIQHILKDVFN